MPIQTFPFIKIVSNGPRDIQILDAHTGEEIPALTKSARCVRWEMGSDGMPVAHIELIAPAIEVVGHLPEISIPGLPKSEG